MDHVRRDYRQCMQPANLTGFSCKYKETDLYVAVDTASYTDHLPAFVEKRVLYYRTLLEQYIEKDPDFQMSLEPYLLQPSAPTMAFAMAKAGNTAGVGPMAAVAGAFAEFIARDLLSHVKQIIVENGGDTFIFLKEKATVIIYAGASPFSNRIALELEPTPGGYGVCTSSGTVGPSLSLGRADAAVIVSPSAVLADAAATATANRIQTPSDLQNALDFARQLPGITGVLLIKDEHIAAWGNLKIVPV